MTKYSKQTRFLVAIDCVIFGFDGENLKLLLIHRGMEPEKDKWSLMGGFVQPDESTDDAAARILKQLTGLEGVYMEQLRAFGNPKRDPIERVISLVYSALIDIHKYKEQLSNDYQPEWFLLKDMPDLIFDHQQMVNEALKNLRYKAALHPVLFELLPERFTLPQLQALYTGVYDAEFDKRNFSRKVLSTGLLIRQKEKDKENSKKGAFYYILDKSQYKDKFQSFLNFVPNPDNFLF
ncbi:NUDIX domain-containing protein [Arcticibacter sp. MXS-1]|uniref:NUDIX hydrolase n=1 Tax=Arcticibacter sp. MXS-1 TaxID=3341726 RepID=UPI0035A87649